MQLQKYEHRPLSLRDAMSQLFDDSFLDPFGTFGSMRGFGATAYPRVDVRAGEKEVIVTANVPGVAASDLSVSVDRDVLTISGTFGDERESGGIREREQGSFSRSFTLPAQVDATSTKATLRNGVLTLTLPRTERAEGTRIEIAEE